MSNVEAAIEAEQQSADAFEATERRAQVYALGGVAGLVAIILAPLGFAPSPAAVTPRRTAWSPRRTRSRRWRTTRCSTGPRSSPCSSRSVALTTREALALLCTGFGRVRDAAQLKGLLERAGRVSTTRAA